MNNTTTLSSEPSKTSRWNKVSAAALTLGVALAGGNLYLLNKTAALESQMMEMRASVKSDIENVTHDFSLRHNEQSHSVAELRQAINETGTRSVEFAKQAANSANSAAKRYSNELSKKLADQADEQLQSQKALAAQLGEMRDTTDQRVTGIASDVTKVSGEVVQTRTDLDKTVADLRSVRGDLGMQSGLIATNSKELAALRTLGERDYVEFQLTKTKEPQRIGDVAVQLKRFDNKRNRYTIELVANDKRVEKRDRTINEPVQFYMAKARMPYEIVVNEVRNDRIVGYLAAPKVRAAR